MLPKIYRYLWLYPFAILMGVFLALAYLCAFIGGGKAGVERATATFR